MTHRTARRAASRSLYPVAATLLALTLSAGAAAATSATATGSRNVATADPAVPRPDTKPCVVKLFSQEDFGREGDNKRMDAIPHPFQYQPPNHCKGPWAKVVLEADFSVDAGYQYDRTASIWFKGVNLYFGTTQEPAPDTAPSWQVQRDLTDYSSLFTSAGKGQAWINNWLSKARHVKLHVSARVLFYPADDNHPAPDVPNEVLALNGKNNTPANLKSADDALSRSMSFPRNTSRVYLDVFAQPQFHDEFYYFCLDEKFSRQTEKFALKRGYKGAPRKPHACGGGSFREVEVSIDGHAAGLAPVSPWVFTGGIDPFLWRPTPGDETLNFMPYRVDLSPFAGQLSDGKKHDVSVRVLDADNFFSLAGAVLVYTDPDVKHTGGSVTRNTLENASVEPQVTSTLGQSSRPGVNGDVITTAHTHYVIEGYVHGAGGRVVHKVDDTIRFGNIQQFATGKDQHHRHVVRQSAHVTGTSSSSGEGSGDRRLHRDLGYVLNVNTVRAPEKDGHKNRKVELRQVFTRHLQQSQKGEPLFLSDSSNVHVGSDHVSYHAGDRKSFHHSGQTSDESFYYSNSLGDCYRGEVKARDGEVTRVSHGQGCLSSEPALHWFVHPDGSPDSFGWRGKAD